MSALRMEKRTGQTLRFLSQRALSRREEQLLLRFFDEGSRQLKLNPASLRK